MRHPVTGGGTDDRGDESGYQAEQTELGEPCGAYLGTGGAEGAEDNRFSQAAAMAPTRTRVPASRVSAPVTLRAAAIWSSRSARADRTSWTRIPVTLGRAS